MREMFLFFIYVFNNLWCRCFTFILWHTIVKENTNYRKGGTIRKCSWNSRVNFQISQLHNEWEKKWNMQKQSTIHCTVGVANQNGIYFLRLVAALWTLTFLMYKKKIKETNRLRKIRCSPFTHIRNFLCLDINNKSYSKHFIRWRWLEGFVLPYLPLKYCYGQFRYRLRLLNSFYLWNITNIKLSTIS